MKQLAIIDIENGDDKQRSKAMKIIVGIAGVESVALQGENKNEIAVIGYGVDSVTLINLLRKKIKQVRLVSVTPVDADFLDDTMITEPEPQHPIHYHRPSYGAVVPYDPQGYNRPNYNDYPYYYKPNNYDYYGNKSHDPDNCSIM